MSANHVISWIAYDIPGTDRVLHWLPQSSAIYILNVYEITIANQQILFH